MSVLVLKLEEHLRGSSGRVQIPFVVKQLVRAQEYAADLARAEVVAALNGNPLGNLPEDVSNWIQSQRKKPDAKLIENARVAVERIRTEEISELKQLWEESNEPPTDWYSAVDDLIERLR